MNKDILQLIVRECFPQSLASLVTGSQAKNSDFLSDSDIDIVVIDPGYAHIGIQTLRIDKFRIDFTIIPAYDIIEMLLYDSEGPRGTVLVMILIGEILDDMYQLIGPVKQFSESVYERARSQPSGRTDILCKDLTKLYNYLKRPLTPPELAIILSETVARLSSLELYRLTGWDAFPFRRSKMLSEKKPSFVETLSLMLKDSISSDNPDIFRSYIKSYLKEYKNSRPELTNSEIKVDIALGNIPEIKFHRGILPKLTKIPALISCFKYSYIIPEKYRRGNRKVRLVFTLNESISAEALAGELKKAFTLEADDLISFELDRNPDGSPLFREAIYRLKEKMSENMEESNDMVLTFYLCKKLASYMGIKTEDKQKLHDISLSCWFPDKGEEAMVKGYTEVALLRKRKMTEMKKNALESREKIEHAAQWMEKKWNEKIEQVFAITKVHGFDSETGPETIICKALLRSSQIADIGLAVRYVLYLKDILMLSALPDREKAYCCYLLMESNNKDW
jgi:hypothetical protein